ncbi:MAG: hypothetical protein Q9171_003571 [Xanthocarpia ochracea]
MAASGSFTPSDNSFHSAGQAHSSPSTTCTPQLFPLSLPETPNVSSLRQQGGLVDSTTFNRFPSRPRGLRRASASPPAKIRCHHFTKSAPTSANFDCTHLTESPSASIPATSRSFTRSASSPPASVHSYSFAAPASRSTNISCDNLEQLAQHTSPKNELQHPANPDNPSHHLNSIVESGLTDSKLGISTIDAYPQTSADKAATYKHRDKRPCRRSRNTEAIRIINATYARCEGRALDAESSRLALPICQSDDRLFLIPATGVQFAEFATLRQRTRVDRSTQITFNPRVLLPGQSAPSQCIQVKMLGPGHEQLARCNEKIAEALSEQDWKDVAGKAVNIQLYGTESTRLTLPGEERFPQPDSGLFVPSLSDMPFLVIESAVSQTNTSVSEKSLKWLRFSRDHIRTVCILELRKVHDQYCVLASVVKPLKISLPPTPQKPERYEIQANRVLSKIEIYPRRAVEAFDIELAEIIPKEIDLAKYHQTMHEKRATVSLGTFWTPAKYAVEAKARGDDKNQPGESGRPTDRVSSEERDDESKDPTYKDPGRKKK